MLYYRLYNYHIYAPEYCIKVKRADDYTDLAESAVYSSNKRQSVADEDDAKTCFDVVQQLVEGRFDGVGYNELSDVEA